MKLNILIVDDSPVMRAMIIKTIKMSDLGENVFFQASNGHEGLEIMKNNWIDLVLADINMPVMNGEEMIDRMRGDDYLKDIPVLVVSTESSESRIEILEKKTSGFVHKPFTPEFIGNKILEVTGAKNG